MNAARVSRGASIVLTGIVALTALSGCSLLRNNVKGSFTCNAPSGMCAPTSTIDDQALALISGDEKRAPNSLIADGPHSPAAMKIVLPARMDRFGRWREPTIVHAEPLERPQLSGAPATNGPATRPTGLMDLAVRAPSISAVGPAQATAPRTTRREQIDAQVRSALAASHSGENKTPSSAGDAKAPPDAGLIRAPALIVDQDGLQ
ncbi:conjugal transfer pilus assembly protein TraV [Sphingobium sp. B2D3A]|uniref:hypothetical protein n=1 Tax=unclassified Sphingobium TaxID=2611147 RepID=UPI0022258FA1|nr:MULTISPECIES: hypothetical protein [unclassified Sphingobium]MCW2339179.1 conjugal transfer pilus assembly protein TraV [Sphingobium sp. B2D3A]MCW2386877.1 conjugal transfer pilus assembly protein TraV [Sphingobium sp. B2D3D]